MSAKYTLYSTVGCHLCEQAENLLQSFSVDMVSVDIAEDELLMQRYGVRIPVLKNSQNDDELGWPFDAAKLQDWLD